MSESRGGVGVIVRRAVTLGEAKHINKRQNFYPLELKQARNYNGANLKTIPASLFGW